MASSDAVIAAVEELATEGSTGFRASAIARKVGSSVDAVAPALLALTRNGALSLRFDLMCPDNGRTIHSFNSDADLPIGQEWQDERCETDEPFIVDRDHIWVVFVPTERWRTTVLRRRARDRAPRDPGGDPPGLARSRRQTQTSCRGSNGGATSRSSTTGGSRFS